MDHIGKTIQTCVLGLSEGLHRACAADWFQSLCRHGRRGGHVRGLNAKGLAATHANRIDELTEYVKTYGAKGLAYIAVEARASIARPSPKFLPAEVLAELINGWKRKPGDLLLFVADQPAVVYETLARCAWSLATG
jgi:aspartyl-tRNA synthetase